MGITKNSECVPSTSLRPQPLFHHPSHLTDLRSKVLLQSQRQRETQTLQILMASIVSTVGVAMVSYRAQSSMEGSRGLKGTSTNLRTRHLPYPLSSSSYGVLPSRRSRPVVVVKAEAQAINPEIRKSEDKVVDSVVVTELSKPLTAYCRCWRSGTFPLCDGSHVKHNKANGDNVGPLLLKKQ